MTKIIGTKEAQYQYKWARLDEASAGFALKNISLSGGKGINIGASFGRGNKDTPLRLLTHPWYQGMIESAQNQYVVMYDVGDRRGWLINGADALLHMVRAFLHHRHTQDTGENEEDFLFKFESLEESESPIKILKSTTNREIPIYRYDDEIAVKEITDSDGKVTITTERKIDYYRFRNCVQDMWSIFEQIGDYQTNLSGPDQQLPTTPCQQLEGFDLKEIISGCHRIFPKVATLRPSGRGIVDFSKSIHSITLFGRGFGELIHPSDPGSICKHWKKVPRHQDFLAACVSDLENIIERRGDKDSSPMKLAKNTFWHKPGKLFEHCNCQKEATSSVSRSLQQVAKCDRVQHLLSPSVGHNICPGKLEANGAVIFSRGERYSFSRSVLGQRAERDQEDEEDVVQQDSGLGSSIDPSSTHESASSAGAESSRGRGIKRILSSATEMGPSNKKPKR